MVDVLAQIVHGLQDAAVESRVGVGQVPQVIDWDPVRYHLVFLGICVELVRDHLTLLLWPQVPAMGTA